MSPDVETRFYLGYVHANQDFADGLTKQQLHTDPQAAAPAAIAFGQGSTNTYARAANKTTIRLGDRAELDVDVYWALRDIDQPLFWDPFFLTGSASSTSTRTPLAATSASSTPRICSRRRTSSSSGLGQVSVS